MAIAIKIAMIKHDHHQLDEGESFLGVTPPSNE